MPLIICASFLSSVKIFNILLGGKHARRKKKRNVRLSKTAYVDENFKSIIFTLNYIHFLLQTVKCLDKNT